MRRRSIAPVSPVVSITTSARSRSEPSTSRSARIPSTIRPSGASGWRRRVSLKRLTRVSSSASRKTTVGSRPGVAQLIEHREQLVEVARRRGRR